jgi:hypothetical protein
VKGELPVPRIVPGDVEVLERRARDLAAGGEADGTATAGLRGLVSFRVRGRACAVDVAVVERAVVIAAPFPVPLADGSERAVAFVEERPLPVADLAGAAVGSPRRAPELSGAPALLVATAAGPVAVVVGGPLELAEDRLAEKTEPGAAGEEDLHIAGRLAGGATLVDAAWLVGWAGKAARP